MISHRTHSFSILCGSSGMKYACSKKCSTLLTASRRATIISAISWVTSIIFNDQGISKRGKFCASASCFSSSDAESLDSPPTRMTMPAILCSMHSRKKRSRLCSSVCISESTTKISSPPCSHWEMVGVKQTYGQVSFRYRPRRPATRRICSKHFSGIRSIQVVDMTYPPPLGYRNYSLCTKEILPVPPNSARRFCSYEKSVGI